MYSHGTAATRGSNTCARVALMILVALVALVALAAEPADAAPAPKPVVVTISSPTSPVLARSFVAQFSATSSSGSITSYRCKLVDSTTRTTLSDATCSSGQTFGGLTDAHKYAFTVTATNSAGSTGTASVTFTASFPLPSPQILNGPANARTTDPSPVFALGQLDPQNYPTQTFECSFVALRAKAVWNACGGGPFATWAVPNAPRANGTYDFSVRARTPSGEIGLPTKYTVTITTWGSSITITPSTTQAAAHPDLNIRILPTAGQLRLADVRLPAGMIGGLTAFPKCAVATSDQGGCGASTQIGTSDALLTVFGATNFPMTGSVYLTEPRVAGDSAGFSIRYPTPQPGVLGDVIIPMRAILTENSSRMRIFSDVIPTSVRNFAANLDSQYWLTDFTMKINGSQGSPFPLLTNPSSCAALQYGWTLGDKMGNSNSGTIPFQATGCASVPSAPHVTETLANATANQTTSVKVGVTAATGESSIRAITVYQPPAIGPNFPAFGGGADQCPASSVANATAVFNPAGCPTQSKVGTMTVTTPLLPAPVTGSVYLINRSPIPWLGVDLVNQALGIKIGIAGVNIFEDPLPGCDPVVDMCMTRMKTSFSAIPDLPVTSMQLDLSGPSRTSSTGTSLSGNMLVTASADDPSCIGSSKVKSVVESHSGKVTTAYQPVTIAGCAQ